MPAGKFQNFQEAISFLSPELRRALEATPDGSTCAMLPNREVAILWSDIRGFSEHTRQFLTDEATGVDALHKQLNRHYDRLIETVFSHGGEPIMFVGDGLLSVWPVKERGLAQATFSAAAAARSLIDTKDAFFDLYHQIATGHLQTLELGGRHGRWLTTSIGSALRELEDLSQIKVVNQVVLSRTAAMHFDNGDISPEANAFLLTATFVEAETARTQLAQPSKKAWPAIVARLPRFAAGWVETVGLDFLAELRPVSALSLALPGFDHSGPQGATNLNEIVMLTQDVVHSRDGYVAEVIVDEKGVSVLVTFGTPPDAHSDDPLRAVSGAQDLQALLKERGIENGIGVATARMLCCIVGNEERRSSLVLGDAVIRATRLSGASDGILVDQWTKDATEGQKTFANEPRKLTFKGDVAESSVWVCDVATVSAKPYSQIFGREAEKNALYDCWAHATSGIYGTNIVIEGESGQGKTTLALDLQKHVQSKGGDVKVVSASSIEKGTPFGALRQLVMDCLGVAPTMAIESRRKAIKARLPYDLRDRAPFLNALFPTGMGETEFTQNLEGQARAVHIQHFVVDLLTQLLGDNPVCLCIDDAQWLDTESRKTLIRIAEISDNIMFALFTQPEPDDAWAAFAQDAGFSHFHLGPLRKSDIEALICAQLGSSQLSPALLDEVSALTSAHPFYTIELVRNLAAKGAIEVKRDKARLAQPDALSGAALPVTLHGMILQRIDRLEPAAQLLLRVAAVAGMVFTTQLVRDIHPIEGSTDQIAEQIEEQVANGFLIPQQQGGQQSYAFATGVLHEVAHSQMPRQQCRSLHAEAAAWIEEHAGDDRASRLQELAHHWAEAGDREKAVACLLEEALRVFSQGFAAEAVQIGLRAIRTAGVNVPLDPTAMQREIQKNIAEIESIAAGRHPTELLTEMQPPQQDLILSYQAILSTAPFAFQSNQFETFAWAATAAMRLVMENAAGPPHAFSMYSIVRSLLTGDAVAGAAWSRAALELDAATGGTALPAAGFIDTWFHGHWRAPLIESVKINKDAAEKSLALNDYQYASYNISGGVVLTSLMGRPLDDVIKHGQEVLSHQLHRNSRMHVDLELQFARALQNKTDDQLSLSDDKIEESRDIAWVGDTELVNQTAFYMATKVRQHRYAGDWDGAIAWHDKIGPIRAAIAGQIIEVDLILHTVLSRFGRLLSGRYLMHEVRTNLDHELAQLARWGDLQPDNFKAKSEIARLVWAGINHDANAPDQLTQLANRLGPDYWLQDRALALEYAARLQPDEGRLQQAIAAYRDWGATGVAARLDADGI